jgi:hypothetical protein
VIKKSLKKLSDSIGSLLASILIFMLIGWPSVCIVATNEAIDPGGGSVSLTSSGPVTVNAVSLELVKQAYTLSGDILPDGAQVLPGEEIYFVLYIDNITFVSADYIRITDIIDESMISYVPNSLEMTAVPSGSSGEVIWAGIWKSLTDTVGGPDDIASAQDTATPAGVDKITIGDVSGQINQGFSRSGNMLQAIRYRVKVR